MKQPIRVVGVLSAVLLISCGDGALTLAPEDSAWSRGNSAGRVEVSTVTSGSDRPTGYVLKVSGQEDREIGINATELFASVPTGDVIVELTEIPSNCTVAEENPRTIRVTPGMTKTSFDINCTAQRATGTLEVSTATTGADLPSGYTLEVTGQENRSIGIDATEIYEGIPAGDYRITLAGVPSNCTVDGDNPHDIVVSADGRAEHTFSVTCVAETGTGTLRVTTATTGDDLPSGYVIKVTDQPDQEIGANATVTYSNIPAATYTVELSQVAGNCVVLGENPRSVTVTTGSTVDAAFSIDCVGRDEDWIRPAEFVTTPTSSSQRGTFEKSNKPVWWHDGHWWVMLHGWYAYRRDAAGTWTEASDRLLTGNSRRLDVHVRPNGDIIFYGQHTSDPRIGTARYDRTTRTYVSTGSFSAPAGSSAGFGSKLWGNIVLDSQDRIWLNWGESGVNRYAVYDLATHAELLGVTTLDSNIWAEEHLSRMVAFRDAEGPKIGVFLDDQVSGEMRFWVRRDTDPLGSGWRKEVVRRGVNEADDHGDVIATPNGEVLAVWKTEHSGSDDPIIRYARRTVSGIWTDQTVVRTRYGSSSSREFTRPRIQYDKDADQVYIVVTTLDNRDVHIIRSSRLNPDFGAYNAPSDGRRWPTPFAWMDSGEKMRNPATSAAFIDGRSGLFFIAVGDSTGKIWGLHIPTH
jgi:hypothetical protein